MAQLYQKRYSCAIFDDAFPKLWLMHGMVRSRWCGLLLRLDGSVNEGTEVLLILGAIVLVLLWSERGRIRARRMRNPFTKTGKRLPDSHFTKEGHPKVGYATKAEAMVEVRRLKSAEGARMNAYRCGGCHQWHVGHAK